MRVLITGASSFTGYWFAKTMSEAGHEVIATFTMPNVESYTDSLRRQRVTRVLDFAEPVFHCRFGDDTFLGTLGNRLIEVLCHHGADATDYKSNDYDFNRALASNTYRIREVLKYLHTGGGKCIITGSIFEGGEGAGSEGLPHFSPYGLSKALTTETFRFYCAQEKVSLGKFVIPNPFGPYEEPRFTNYLVRSWQSAKTPTVQTPAYVRDNIHVTLLAHAYCKFVEQVPTTAQYTKLNPSGYIESQGAFAQRFAREMEPRLGIPCPIELAIQTEFREPRIRINLDQVVLPTGYWNEAAAWDSIAEYYASNSSVPN